MSDKLHSVPRPHKFLRKNATCPANDDSHCRIYILSSKLFLTFQYHFSFVCTLSFSRARQLLCVQVKLCGATKFPYFGSSVLANIHRSRRGITFHLFAALRVRLSWAAAQFGRQRASVAQRTTNLREWAMNERRYFTERNTAWQWRGPRLQQSTLNTKNNCFHIICWLKSTMLFLTAVINNYARCLWGSRQ